MQARAFTIAELLGIEGEQLRGFYPVVGAVILASLLLLHFVPEQRRRPEKRDEVFGLRVVLKALAVRRLLPVWVASCVFSGLVATYMAFVTVAAGDAGVERPALLWATYTLGATFVRLFGALGIRVRCHRVSVRFRRILCARSSRIGHIFRILARIVSA